MTVSCLVPCICLYPSLCCDLVIGSRDGGWRLLAAGGGWRRPAAAGGGWRRSAPGSSSPGNGPDGAGLQTLPAEPLIESKRPGPGLPVKPTWPAQPAATCGTLIGRACANSAGRRDARPARRSPPRPAARTHDKITKTLTRWGWWRAAGQQGAGRVAGCRPFASERAGASHSATPPKHTGIEKLFLAPPAPNPC